MITWLKIWPLLLMPTVILSAIDAFPTSLIGGRVLGGGPVREYYLNTFSCRCCLQTLPLRWLVGFLQPVLCRNGYWLLPYP